MLQLTPHKTPGQLRTVLCLGAHCDDIEIGCGGTIIKMTGTHENISVHWVVFSSNETRGDEALKSANRFLQTPKEKQVVIKNFRDGFFPYSGTAIKEFFEEIKAGVSPDIIFTHFRGDFHQDHRLISELTWNTFRDHLIFEYEIPKYDGDLGAPNFFVPLEEDVCKQKCSIIEDSFRSQGGNHWFSETTFLSLARLRGIESNAGSGYAEAFYCKKAIFS